ncbi:MAG: type II toxin-antitoxin system HigB family toxin [Tepidisphaerales bacterium]
MHVISRKALRRFAERHPDAAGPLDRWYELASRAQWASIAGVRQVWPQADAVRVASGHAVTVFNVGGNKYRLLAAIHYNRQKLFVLAMLTHGEYSTGGWKEQL